MKQLEDVLEEALNWELADLTLSSPKKGRRYSENQGAPGDY